MDLSEKKADVLTIFNHQKVDLKWFNQQKTGFHHQKSGIHREK